MTSTHFRRHMPHILCHDVFFLWLESNNRLSIFILNLCLKSGASKQFNFVEISKAQLLILIE